MNQAATIQLTTKQTDYLSRLIGTDSSFTSLVCSHPNMRLGKDSIALDRTDAEMLSDFFGERLAKVGFDANCEPNEEGVLLEGLIDAIFPLLAQ